MKIREHFNYFLPREIIGPDQSTREKNLRAENQRLRENLSELRDRLRIEDIDHLEKKLRGKRLEGTGKEYKKLLDTIELVCEVEESK